MLHKMSERNKSAPQDAKRSFFTQSTHAQAARTQKKQLKSAPQAANKEGEGGKNTRKSANSVAAIVNSIFTIEFLTTVGMPKFSEIFSPVASLIVPGFTIYVYDSSCNYLFFGLILAPLLSLYIA